MTLKRRTLAALAIVAIDVGGIALGCALEPGGTGAAPDSGADGSLPEPTKDGSVPDAGPARDGAGFLAEGGPIVLSASGPSWRVDDGGAAALISDACIPDAWTPSDSGASWVWASSCAAADDESHVFSSTFELGALTFGQLFIAVDDYALVRVNDVSLPTSCSLGDATPPIQGVACSSASVVVIDVTQYLKVGTNTLAIEAHNMPVGVDAAWGNPAGVLAWVVAR